MLFLGNEIIVEGEIFLSHLKESFYALVLNFFQFNSSRSVIVLAPIDQFQCVKRNYDMHQNTVIIF